jgi:Domain of unknown function (DUF4390)
MSIFCHFRGQNTLSNRKFYCFLGLVLSLLSTSLHATDAASTIKHANLALQDGNYVLSANINYHFSKKALNALQHGVALFWIIQIKLQQQRDILWNKTLIDKEISYRIQYHALLNMYRVKNQSSGEVYNFATFAAALDLMSNLHNFPLLARERIDLNAHHYRAAIRVVFNRNALPLPLQPIAYLNPQWYLSSDWYLCPLTK